MNRKKRNDDPWGGVPHAVELTEIPQCDSNISTASVLCGLVDGGRRDCAWIGYESNSGGAVALVRLDHAAHLAAHGPNDEAFHNHPYYKHGLRHYTIQELVHSPLIEEIFTRLHKDGTYSGPDGYRHFVFALKETTVDCIAHGVEFVGRFPSHSEAMRVACAELVS